MSAIPPIPNTHNSSMPPLTGVYGFSDSDIFVCGYAGTILHYDGSNWAVMNSGHTLPQYDIWGTSPESVYIVGNSGKILHYDGTSWETMPSPTSYHLMDIWGTSDSDIYAVGYDMWNAVVIHYDGESWSQIYHQSGERFIDVLGTSSDDVYVAGHEGRLWHYDGVSWTVEHSVSGKLIGLWGDAQNGFFCVGQYGRILFKPRTDGLVAYYPFNGNANDESGFGHHGTVYGAALTTDRFGEPNSAYSFDGNSYILISDAPSLDLNLKMTISAWVRTNSTISQTVVRKEGGTKSTPMNYSLGVRSDFSFKGGFENDSGADYVVFSNGYVSAGEWQHIAFIYDGSVGQTYLNGVLDNTVTLNGIPSVQDYDVLIGLGLRASAYFVGDIDEVRIYNRDLSQKELLELYEQGKPNTTPIANAGNDQSAHPGDIVSLDGGGSTDPDENYPLTYAWEIVSKPEGSSAELSNPSEAQTTFTADIWGEYVIRLIVTDNLGASSAPDEVIVSPFNTPPLAKVNEDQVITEIGTTVQLDGTGSYDEEGDLLVYNWSFLSKPTGSLAELSDVNSETPTFVADVQGEYIVQLIVDDGWTNSEPATTTISFENVAPVADAGENQSAIAGDTLYLDGSGSSDANLDPLTYSWSIVSKPEGSAAEISEPSLVKPYFMADQPGEYIISLVVNDGYVDSEPANATVVAISPEFCI